MVRGDICTITMRRLILLVSLVGLVRLGDVRLDMDTSRSGL